MIESITVVGMNGYQIQLNTGGSDYPVTSFDITYDTRGDDADKSQDHGTWPTPDYLGNAHVSIECDIVGQNAADYWQKRVALLAPFAPIPQLGFENTVQVFYNFTGFSEIVGGFANLDGSMPDMPLTTDFPFISKAQINLKMRDPRFYAQFAQEVVLSAPATNTGFSLPISFPLTLTSSGASTNSATNAGFAFTSPTIVVTGPCQNPTVSVIRPGGTVESWGLSGVTIPAGSTMTADFGKRTVLLDDQFSLFRYKTLQSKWWQLWGGANTVSFTAINADPATCEAHIQWQNAYFF